MCGACHKWGIGRNAAGCQLYATTKSSSADIVNNCTMCTGVKHRTRTPNLCGFDEIHLSTVNAHCASDKAFTQLAIKVLQLKGKHTLHVKIDTGANATAAANVPPDVQQQRSVVHFIPNEKRKAHCLLWQKR
jgi:hypothetical protein